MKSKNLKICCEESCGNVYVPDIYRESKCPKCNSEGIWLNIITEGDRNKCIAQDAKTN